MSGLHEEHIKGSVFNQRIFVVVAVEFLMILLLMIRLFQLQIADFDAYLKKANSNRIKVNVIQALRSDILDRNNVKLTDNKTNYEVVLLRNKTNDYVVKELIDILQLNVKQQKLLNTKLKKERYRPTVSILNNLTWNELIKLESNTHKLEGLSIEEGYLRSYLHSESFAHIIGYIAPPNEDEIKMMSNKISKDVLLHPAYKIGKVGLEKQLNNRLTGEVGYKKVEVNVFGTPLRTLEVKESQNAEPLRLTIDAKLQNYVYNLLKDYSGSAIVLDVNSGEILSMVSTPSYDPNQFVNGISKENFWELTSNTLKPLFNRSISATYPIGSIMKPVVAIAALNNGWQEDKNIKCSGQTRFYKRNFRCWKKSGHGSLDLVEAIQKSCNIYFANLGLFTGIDNISKTARDFGLGENFKIGLPDYRAGIMPDRLWKRKAHNENWTHGDTINVSIGQGFVLANPLQMAVMVSRIANGGYPIKPFLLYDSKRREENKKLFTLEPLASPQTMNLVKLGMYNVVNQEGGTVYHSRIRNEKFAMAGKTGTAQVISLEMKNLLLQKNEELETKFKNHGLFIAFAPYDKPKYGIAIVVEHSGGGAVLAAPLAKKILTFAQQERIGVFDF